MSFNFLNFGGKIISSDKCLYDSNIGYSSKFDDNGSVDNWTYYDGIHTYGCWNSFIFGTLYRSYGCIGLGETFPPVEAEYFHIVRLVVKFNFVERRDGQLLPTKGKLYWRTINNTVWNTDKSYEFDINNDSEWHTYVINLSDAQMWQGQVNDLRIYPILENGRKGDEFFIRSIEIVSNDTYICNNVSCDYYSNYQRNCLGVGEQGFCKSERLSSFVSGGTTFEFAETRTYNIEEGDNDELFVNINEYGYERVRIPHVKNCTGEKLSGIIAKEISRLDVGGYAECSVDYTDYGEFVIYSGTYANDSKISIGYSKLAVQLGFFDSKGLDISTKHTGSYPASGFRNYSSYRIKTYQLYSLLDSNNSSGFSFNPKIYNVEGGRRDWLDTGLGQPTMNVRGSESDDSGLMNRVLDSLDNQGKTIIDFNHPINASGRIKKIYVACTLDAVHNNSWAGRGANDTVRKQNQLVGAKIMFFRPTINGNLRVLPIEVPISDRNFVSGKLYSALQEYIAIDCDVFLNKGDYIGVYNANVYIGRSVTGKEIDASYYQVEGKPADMIEVANTMGDGSAGLMIYARSDQCQDRLSISLDLNKRVNISDIEIIGTPKELSLDYNIAMCLDINWEVDLFGGDHTTGYVSSTHPIGKMFFNHPNIYYGLDCLSDGIRVVPDGISADSFSVSIGTGYESYYEALHEKDGGAGVIPQGAKYFHCNGDVEWLGVYQFAGQAYFAEADFGNDPLSFTIRFPMDEEKLIYKSKIYFKEQYNFRSFGLSTYNGPFYSSGNADDPRFTYIPDRDGYSTPWTKILLDGIEYTPDSPQWDNIDLYLAKNPCIGHAIIKINTVIEHTFDETLAYYTDDGGLQYTAAGYITNNDQFTQSTATDWSTIEHNWEPIKAKGFRIYCDNHKSTKICEMELYCQVENVRSSMTSSLDIAYSEYGDYWWPTTGTEGESSVVAYIGDSPRYLNIIVKPINEIQISEIKLNVSYEDVYMGEKGCTHIALPNETRVGYLYNAPQVVNFKNVYDKSYDLYVDIARDELKDEGTIFYSLMSDDDSIESPLVGPNAYYKKHPEYIFKNYQGNVAINCPVYALKNLMQGASAWYTYDKDYSWKYFGVLDGGQNVDFSNLPNMTITTINIPPASRSKWWKIGFNDQRIVMNVREMQVYYNNVEISAKFYYKQAQDVNYSANDDEAPHLKNGVIYGSYYVLKQGSYIGIELPEVQQIDRIIIYHDRLLEYENSHDKAGIDSSTALCIYGDGDTYQIDSIVDESYYEHEITVVGTGIYCEEGSKDDIYYDFTQDFSDCAVLIDTFSSFNNSFWSNIANGSVSGGKLNITNSVVIGKVISVDLFNDDFSANVDLDIIGSYNGRGWGCYLQAEDLSGRIVRVGRTYHHTVPNNRFSLEVYGGTGWEIIGSTANTDTTGMGLRLSRDGDTITCYAKNSAGVWSTIGSSNIIGSNDVNISLISDLTPLSSGITTASFDNFSIDKSDADWGINTGDSSTFTCTSGVGPSGYAYVFDTICANHSNSSGYKIPRIYSTQSYPLDEGFAFVFDFSFRMSQFLTSPTGSSVDTCGISVGLLGKHVELYTFYSNYDWYPHPTGAQISLTRDRIGIVVRNDVVEIDSLYTPLSTTTQTYFCRFTSDGEGHYHCYVWTDTWNGSANVVDFGIDSTIRWEAWKIGVGSGFSPSTSWTGNYRARGWVSDFDFSCSKSARHSVIGRSSIRFSGNPSDRLLINYNNSSLCNVNKYGFDFKDKKVTIDFFLKFNSLPTTNGSLIYIIKLWDDTVTPVNGGPANSSCSWAIVIELENEKYYWRFYVNINNLCSRFISAEYFPELHRWHHYYFCRGLENSATSYVRFIVDGHPIFGATSSLASQIINTSTNNVVIGHNLDGWIEQIRVSSDYTDGGGRVLSQNSIYDLLSKQVPTSFYKRYYTFSLYSSTDNIFYGKEIDVDVLFSNSRSGYMPFSQWSLPYYTNFTIDLGQRYDIDIVRSYPIDTAYSFSSSSNVLYSSKDTSDPYQAFLFSQSEQMVSSDFSGQDYSYPENWTKLDSIRATSYIKDNMFNQICAPVSATESAIAESKFFLQGDFDIEIDYDLGGAIVDSNSWAASIKVTDINNANNSVTIERSYRDSNHQYALWANDNNVSSTKKFGHFRQPVRGSMRLVRVGVVFTMYVKDFGAPIDDYESLGSYQMLNTYGIESRIRIRMVSSSTTFPTTQVFWDNFNIISGNISYSNQHDARWLKIKMLNGDGVLKTIKNLDIYPTVSVNTNAVGQYNTYWESIGSSVTSYNSMENIALLATISGSSYVGLMTPENVVDGLIYDDIRYCWGSDDEANPWIAVYFDEVEPIFRVKLFHGYNTSDAFNIITDYKVQVSTDGIAFSTIFTITSNDSYERTHDLLTPVSAKVVRIYVDNYKAINRFIWASAVEGYRFWRGAVLREIEIYKYYNFETLSSETTPIIAINLQQPFFINSHSLIGANAEATDRDWDNTDSNFAWSSSRSPDPSKVSFGQFGGSPYYSQWVVVKRNTASKYPTLPGGYTPNTDTPDYLRHVVISASADEVDSKPNPIEYPWMWASNISSISYDYNVISDGKLGSRSLKISYPASNDPDHIRFIEGDHFGWDDVCSWRDGFGLNIYIDDINNIDLSYGYIYLGGYDYTQVENPVKFRWNLPTVSGILHSGWNPLTLCFMYADNVEYTKPLDLSLSDPRRLYSIKWGSVGIVFRGANRPLQLNIEGMYIARNYFSHAAYPGQRGLYLHDHEFLKAIVGDVDLNAMTIEFWIRPDWDTDGTDIYNDFKFRTLFHFSNVANDIFGALVSSRGIEVYYGNLMHDFNSFVVSGAKYSTIDELTHMAFVCSSNGQNISSDNSTIRVYINNVMIGKTSSTWLVSDDKYFDFKLGGQGVLPLKSQSSKAVSSSVDGVVCRLKIHNFCKTDFGDSISDSNCGYTEVLTKPSNFIEISKDNVTYHRVDSEELPFFFEDVPSEGTVPIWVRVVVPKGLTGGEKRTAQLVGSWDIGV